MLGCCGTITKIECHEAAWRRMSNHSHDGMPRALGAGTHEIEKRWVDWVAVVAFAALTRLLFRHMLPRTDIRAHLVRACRRHANQWRWAGSEGAVRTRGNERKIGTWRKRTLIEFFPQLVPRSSDRP